VLILNDSLQFIARTVKLAEHNGHIHALSHGWHCYVIRALLRKSRFSRLLNLFDTLLELFMAFDIHHPFFLNAFVMEFAACIEIVAGLLSGAAGPSNATVFPISNSKRITVLHNARPAAIWLRGSVGLGSHNNFKAMEYVRR
jgi:hypothetical protein